MTNDTLLPKLLRSVDWGNRAMVQEGYRVMYAWEQPRPIVALTMLNDHFPDPKVRGYASLCLERMRDETLSQYILQLTQTLKHEPFHDSGLGKLSDAVVAVIIVRIVFSSSFFFYCLLLNHSFSTNPNSFTNCFKLFLSQLYNYICSMRYFDF